VGVINNPLLLDQWSSVPPLNKQKQISFPFLGTVILTHFSPEGGNIDTLVKAGRRNFHHLKKCRIKNVS
jgi:hypothetical protein